MEKNLKEKAINIKGKSYVLVADRIIFFNETYPKGCIETQILSDINSDKIIIKAVVYPEGKDGRSFNGHSQATIGDGYINKTSALENAETSAVGRALALMGIGVIDSIASIDEIKKAEGSTGKKVAQKADGLFCTACEAQAVISAKTNKPYCPNFLKHKNNGEKYNLSPKVEEIIINTDEPPFE